MMREHPAVSQLKAVRENKVIEIPGIEMDPSVRTVDALKALGAGLDKIAGRG
jgi:iron complex transport system substrate-binding protein